MAPPNKPFVFYSDKIEAKSYFDQKAKKKKYSVKGYVTSGDLDLVNDILTKGCMKDIDSQMGGRVLKLDYDHETIKGKSDLDKKLALTKSPLGKQISKGIDAKGNYVEFELNENWKQFDAKGNITKSFSEIWAEIKGGFLDAFSIAYVPVKTASKSINGVVARILDKVNVINIALTGNPINPAASMTSVMAKSLDYLKNQEDGNMQKKSYDKDGAHAHPADNPIGEHNHPEIEKEISRIWDSIWEVKERISEVHNPTEDSPMMGKSKNKTGGNMTEENKETPATPAEPAKAVDPAEKPGESKPEDGKETPAPTGDGSGDAPAATPDTEAKSIIQFKSQLDVLTKSVENIEKVLAKVIPTGTGPANPAVKAAQTEIKSSPATGSLDFV